ncbi:MAG: flavodoxin-dependent (E)-4-hydroxy-3-methylbut-2-enyl-diphosphate synthase [Ruminococcus sp.]|jgi:(E)-4-hydroxy-3-methylbut-2-enyl-diphosphate synthase|nr:flavodoxin-dependent (E)-4-hydroxy-3-methylbut-2-enyl-diphosphate synthase [Ruminococcus sp.]
MIKVGNLPLDGKKIYVQTMLNVIASDVEGNVQQARRVAALGADIIRVSVPSMNDVKLITALKNAVSVPIVADIHFNADIAVASAKAGADKIRINPGNIGDENKIKLVADACKSAYIPIRIGVNSGSVPKEILAKFGSATAEALAVTAIENIRALEKADFYDIVVSVKSSDVKTMIEANRKLAETTKYPLHLGVTEAGTLQTGLIKSAAGIGALLADGIGATIRVSLSDTPENEVIAGKNILKALNLSPGIKVIACPTCGRTRIDVINIARRLEKQTEDINKTLTVAVMGCIVNGPGEAKGADIAVAGGNHSADLYIKGTKIRTIPEAEIEAVLLQEINDWRC